MDFGIVTEDTNGRRKDNGPSSLLNLEDVL